MLFAKISASAIPQRASAGRCSTRWPSWASPNWRRGLRRTTTNRWYERGGNRQADGAPRMRPPACTMFIQRAAQPVMNFGTAGRPVQAAR